MNALRGLRCRVGGLIAEWRAAGGQLTVDDPVCLAQRLTLADCANELEALAAESEGAVNYKKHKPECPAAPCRPMFDTRYMKKPRCETHLIWADVVPCHVYDAQGCTCNAPDTPKDAAPDEKDIASVLRVAAYKPPFTSDYERGPFGCEGSFVVRDGRNYEIGHSDIALLLNILTGPTPESAVSDAAGRIGGNDGQPLPPSPHRTTER